MRTDKEYPRAVLMCELHCTAFAYASHHENFLHDKRPIHNDVYAVHELEIDKSDGNATDFSHSRATESRRGTMCSRLHGIEQLARLRTCLDMNSYRHTVAGPLQNPDG